MIFLQKLLLYQNIFVSLHRVFARNTYYNRTYFFEYRRGKFLIPPAMQEEIRGLFRETGWNGEVKFDSHIEDYDW